MTGNTDKNQIRAQGGYAILELLFYVSFLAAISIAVISSLVTMTSTFRETSLYAALAQSGSIMERMTHEVRQAESIALASSGNLTLNTRDEAGNPATVQFLLSGADVELYEDGVLVGDLNGNNISVDGLTFTTIATPEGVGVRIYMAVRAVQDAQSRNFDFFDTVTLRGAY